jgi:outer membrane protein
MLTEIISLCFASYFVNGCASGKNMNGSFKKKKLSGGDLKIGYVRDEEILSSTKEGKKMLEKIQKEKERISLKFQNDVINLDKEIKDYERKKPLLSVEEHKKKQKKLTELQEKLQNFEMENQQNFQTFQNKLISPLMNKIQENINNYALENEYDYILTHQPIVYAQEKYDITQKIIEMLDGSD